jgi:hypothetical protein
MKPSRSTEKTSIFLNVYVEIKDNHCKFLHAHYGEDVKELAMK